MRLQSTAAGTETGYCATQPRNSPSVPFTGGSGEPPEHAQASRASAAFQSTFRKNAAM